MKLLTWASTYISPEDEDRFRELIEEAIAAKEVKRFKAFKKEVKNDEKRKKKADKVCM